MGACSNRIFWYILGVLGGLGGTNWAKRPWKPLEKALKSLKNNEKHLKNIKTTLNFIQIHWFSVTKSLHNSASKMAETEERNSPSEGLALFWCGTAAAAAPKGVPDWDHLGSLFCARDPGKGISKVVPFLISFWRNFGAQNGLQNGVEIAPKIVNFGVHFWILFFGSFGGI